MIYRHFIFYLRLRRTKSDALTGNEACIIIGVEVLFSTPEQVCPKIGKDSNYLENWRPISLTNIDAKIVSEVLAARIIPVLPKIINSTQTGYVKGRFIGEAARSILDVMDYAKNQNILGILLFIDFEKAFDSLDWNFMLLRSLNVFGFGPSVIRWIETLYTNISRCVLNNRLCSPYFEVKRGVRRGDPLSPYLFIIAAEIVAIAIQTNMDIHGLQIGKEEFKLVQYADDLTVFVPNIECKTCFPLA